MIGIASAPPQLRSDAFTMFDAGTKPAAEEVWTRALQHASDAQIAYARAAATLEAAFFLDTGRDEVRRRLAEVMFERIELAEREHRDETERSELEARLANHDREGVIAASRSARASLQIENEPKHSKIRLVDENGANAHAASLAPGTYVLTASAAGYETVTSPVRVARGEVAKVRFTLPTTVPAGFVYVPAGEFLFGSRDHELMRGFQGAPPMHTRRTNAFLIARTEVTYASWIEFLEASSADERQRRAPRIESSATVQEGGNVQLREVDRTWELVINPAGHVVYTARAGSPIEYRERSRRRIQDWLQFPVAGITPEDDMDRDGGARSRASRACTPRS